MPIDDETQGVINTITTAGFTVSAERTPEGLWIAKAIHRNTRERTVETAHDSLAAAVKLARRLKVPLEDW